MKTGEDLFYVLVDPAAGADINVALAGIAIDPDQLDAFTEWMMKNTIGFGDAGPIVTISGLHTHSGSASHAYDAMKEQGMVKSPDFFFIEPFIAGRDATLAGQTTGQMEIYWVIYGLAGILALIGVKKLQAGGQDKPAAVKPAAAMPLTADRMPAGRGAGAYSLEEMQAGRMLPAATAEPSPVPNKAVKPRKSTSSRLILPLLAVFVLALITGQSWARMLFPLIFFGGVFLGTRNSFRLLMTGLEGVMGAFGKKSPIADPAAVEPKSALPGWAGVQKGNVEASPPKRTEKPAPSDGGPIRSGGGIFRPAVAKTAGRSDPVFCGKICCHRQRRNLPQGRTLLIDWRNKDCGRLTPPRAADARFLRLGAV